MTGPWGPAATGAIWTAAPPAAAPCPLVEGTAGALFILNASIGSVVRRPQIFKTSLPGGSVGFEPMLVTSIVQSRHKLINLALSREACFPPFLINQPLRGFLINSSWII